MPVSAQIYHGRRQTGFNHLGAYLLQDFHSRSEILIHLWLTPVYVLLLSFRAMGELLNRLFLFHTLFGHHAWQRVDMLQVTMGVSLACYACEVHAAASPMLQSAILFRGLHSVTLQLRLTVSSSWRGSHGGLARKGGEGAEVRVLPLAADRWPVWVVVETQGLCSSYKSM